MPNSPPAAQGTWLLQVQCDDNNRRPPPRHHPRFALGVRVVVADEGLWPTWTGATGTIAERSSGQRGLWSYRLILDTPDPELPDGLWMWERCLQVVAEPPSETEPSPP